MFLHCPAKRVTAFHREAWALFRLAHYRSPNVPGQVWQRTIGYADLTELPANILDAWDVMEQETYLLGADIRQDQQGQQAKDAKPQ